MTNCEFYHEDILMLYLIMYNKLNDFDLSKKEKKIEELIKYIDKK